MIERVATTTSSYLRKALNRLVYIVDGHPMITIAGLEDVRTGRSLR